MKQFRSSGCWGICPWRQIKALSDGWKWQNTLRWWLLLKMQLLVGFLAASVSASICDMVPAYCCWLLSKVMNNSEVPNQTSYYYYIKGKQSSFFSLTHAHLISWFEETHIYMETDRVTKSWLEVDSVALLKRGFFDMAQFFFGRHTVQSIFAL